MDVESEMKWYAIFVETGQEENFEKLINVLYPDENINILIPKRKLIERRQGKVYEITKKLFPGYVLVRTVMTTDVYYKLSKLPRVYGVLKDETEPVPIRDEEMAVILALTSEGETIGFSEVYKEGERIVVISGPLKGLEGIIERIDARKKRVKVRIQFLGREKRVDLGAHLIDRKSE
ncbi:transcriptional antiterminator NusG [Caldicoprobacter guelmensis]|uniref:antiterminator LoaP n=1 Tax=Caldicoprobacter guelmensis TaxID=1170224 RepID=UPI001959D500|nr:antiterminator LoaP [Caldicoprobacter guelmensis]MBM7581709.1 transcriptional antiterminator NusG [Caldicoprobacter guelmensis]